jgi:hypothetical protein
LKDKSHQLAERAAILGRRGTSAKMKRSNSRKAEVFGEKSSWIYV